MNLLALLRKRKLDKHMDAEMRSHIEMQMQENMEAGMSPEQARYAALRQFGHVDSIKETCRDQRGISRLEGLIQDIRFGARGLRKNPGFTAAAIITLLIGIGANTVIFSIVNAVLFRPLPFKDANQLVHVWVTLPQMPNIMLGHSFSAFADMREESKTFEQLAMYQTSKLNLTGVGAPEELAVAEISSDFFPMLGVQPFIGRQFSPTEESPGNGHVAILGESLWRSRFGSDSNVVGKAIRLNEALYQVIGVMPAGFHFPQRADLWIPLPVADKNDQRNALVLGRLRPGITKTAAQEEVNLIAARRLADNRIPENLKSILRVQYLHETVIGDSRPAFLILLGASGFLMLIACANVGNLALTRCIKRQRETAIRLALGASRQRIVRLYYAESFILAGAAGIAGLLFTAWGISTFRSWLPANMPRIEEIRLDSSTLWIALANTIVVGTILSAFPALQFSRLSANSSMHKPGASSVNPLRYNRLRNALIVGQIATVLVLLCGSLLTMQSLVNLMRTEPGFRPDNLLTLGIHLPQAKYERASQQIDFVNQALGRFKHLNGVTSVAASSGSIMRNNADISAVEFEEAQINPPGSIKTVNIKHVTPSFFRVLEIRLLNGRAFTDHDSQDTLPVAIINESMARQFWPGQNAVGKRLSLQHGPDGKPVWIEIIGVVNNTRDIALHTSPRPLVFLPFSQQPQTRISFYLRTSEIPRALATAVQNQIWAIDPSQPIASISTMEAAIAEHVSTPRFRTLLLGSFATLGLALALIGIYSVISYSVSQRTSEIGTRMALGATPRHIVHLVLGEGAHLTFLGIVIGLLATLSLIPVLRQILFGISALDPLAFVIVASIIFATGLTACYFPARRAARIEPMKALRYE